MAGSRKALTVGALGVGAMALIGAGASATFTDNIHAAQSIEAGRLNVSVSGPTGTNSDGKTVTLPDLGPVGSTFTTGPQRVLATNLGSIDAHAVQLSAAATGGPRSLHAEIYVKIVRWSGSNGTGAATEVFNDTLANLERQPIRIAGPVVAPKDWDQFDVTFYAGRDGAPSLSNPSQGAAVVPTITVDYEG